MASNTDRKLGRGMRLWIILSAFVVFWPNYVRCQFEGDVRLGDGAQNGRGRVEIYHDNQWGTICDDTWDISDAQVVCRQLGLGTINARGYTAISPGSGPIHLDGTYCVGTEYRLDSCSHEWGQNNCGHSEDAAVECDPDEGDVRLVDGSTPNQGRVEIYHNYQWGTVCDDRWGDSDARVVCRQLGYSGDVGEARSGGTYGRGYYPTYLDEVGCSGYESRLEYCTHDGWGIEDCSHSEDAGVYCYDNNDPDEGNVRLAGGSTPNQGRVEIYHNSLWGTVCDDRWGDSDARVVCRQLGYSGDVGEARTGGTYGQGSEPTYLDEVGCSGYESRLEYCTHDGWGIEDCSHSEDAGVYCYDNNDNDLEGDVRMVDGFSSDEGRVEIFHEGQWGTVCHDSWDDSDARVVCRQLGYSGDVGIATSGSTYGGGSDPIFLDDVTCSGYEARLEYCSHQEWGSNYCGHSEDAGVQCRSPATSSGVVGIMSFVGVSLSLLTLFALVAVCYTCSQRKPAVIPTQSDQVPLITSELISCR
ncbi:scavenger receptor cysteine-rich domain-containing group B protein [Strongylocentrotus purpuratus]|uniref:SRCR domain-containing protein n=1 Tax=Strongylocentrotus purpuratus TaxID=7668 RepID=A0A7M7RAA3_STRPU|nr:scavenger receptor cysteine-rich domain-containing group B protein [Strongylocentrotus purpuratus]|eukprot:XP_782286.3 PREDICTED: scavenger receptor cysteine-rich domain-containing group B protein [Strongylocentrotus purpuratus]